jgi:hypothetical protein
VTLASPIGFHDRPRRWETAALLRLAFHSFQRQRDHKRRCNVGCVGSLHRFLQLRRDVTPGRFCPECFGRCRSIISSFIRGYGERTRQGRDQFGRDGIAGGIL